jgi:hypothetical protein
VVDARTLLRGAAGAAVALGFVAAVAALAHLPLGDPPADGELLVALRTAQARVETCTERTPAELAALPAHMRQLRVCDEVAVDYRLRVAVDGAPQVDRRIAHRGLRRTRPLVTDDRVRVAPGPHRIEISWLPIDPPADARDLPRPTFDETIDFTAGRIELVVLDGAGRLRRAPG